jgi:hypothetical protein
MEASLNIISPKRLADLHPDLFTVATLQRWRTAGIGPPHLVLGPRRIAYDLDSVRRWLGERVARSTADARERGLAA